MREDVKKLAVRRVKPLVSDAVWQRLRGLGGATDAAHASPAGQRPLPTLTELGRSFGTDKAKGHHYTEHYERHLGHLRDTRFTLLEIGIGGYANANRGGASLQMWRAFFPRAQIVGLDVQDKSHAVAPRIAVYRGSQTDGEVLRRIVAEHGRPQVVIDDGSHRCEHIRATFDILFPLLADDGIYAVEDTQTSYWPRFGGSPDRQARDTTMAMVKDLLDGLNHAEFPDPDYTPSYSDLHVRSVTGYHNLVFIQKGENSEASNIGKDSPLRQP